MSIRLKYALYGVLFGLCFPLFAFIIQISVGNLPYNFYGIKEAHDKNILLYMIDTAPLFLGIFALIGGISKDKTVKLLNLFKVLADSLKNSNTNLEKKSGDIFSFLLKSTNEIKALTDKLLNSNETLYSSITTNKKKADELDKCAKKLMSSTSELIEINKGLKINNDKLYSQFENLKNFSKKLNLNINKIKDVGNEINVLSINSSIEAHRYGTSGKGFSVIAQQVKSLASNIDNLNNKNQAITNDLNNKIIELYEIIDFQNNQLKGIINLISGIEDQINLSTSGLSDINENIEISMQIQNSQKNHFYEVNNEISRLSEEKLDLIQSLKKFNSSNTELIGKISSI